MAALVLAVLMLGLVRPVPLSATSGAYEWPVGGALLVGFAAPADPYATGHRGVDIAAASGEVVTAMAAGRVTFAGSVAGTFWVTVQHADGIRTSVGPLHATAVSKGDAVAAGQRVGRAAGQAHGTVSGLHVGARLGERYLDPRTLVTPRVASLTGPGMVEIATSEQPQRLPTLVPRTPPSPNRIVVVGGLMSSTDHPPFMATELGYGDADAESFSYSGIDGDGLPADYDAEDTWQRVHDAAVLLGRQLKASQQRHPGRAVDLVGHSLGGLVAMYYLLVLHDPTDPATPPIGKVVTIASPLQGADLAVAVDIAQHDPVLAALLGLADAAYAPMSLAAPVLDDLRPDSAVVAALADAYDRARADPFGGPLATGTDILTIGALLDPVVPAHRSEVGDATNITVPATHGGAPADVATQEIITAFLAGRPLPAPSPGQQVASALRPATVIVSLVEQLLPALM